MSVSLPHRLAVLVVDDDAAMRSLLSDELAARGFDCVVVESGERALDELSRGASFDVVVTDLSLPGVSGHDVCRQIHVSHPHVPVIVMTGYGSIDVAVAMIRAGAADFLSKPFDPAELAVRIEKAFERSALSNELTRLRGEVRVRYGELQGESEVMRRIFARLDLIAGSNAAVLIRGETGTGKELVARELHRRSGRASGPFVAVNCAALPESLLESELFGHVRGAFTGAHVARPGLFVQATGGTLLLDEIGEMTPAMQAKLLRALQERRVRPVGGSREVPFDVWVVCASHRDLEAMVASGSFREDLYYRVCVLDVVLPPLRERGSDVVLIAKSLIASCAARAQKEIRGLSWEAERVLLEYPFPGNVRELANAIEHAVALCEGGVIEPAHLPSRLATTIPRANPAPGVFGPLEPLAEVERRHVLVVLEAHGGNVTHAARTLGLDRKTLGTKLRAWGVRSAR